MNEVAQLLSPREATRQVVPPVRAGASFTPAHVLGVIRRRLWLIALATLLALAVGVYAVRSATPQFVAGGQMVLGQQGRSGGSSLDLVEERALTNSVIQGELAILRSSALLARVARELDLQGDPEFNPALRPPPGRTPILDDVRDGLSDALAAARARLRPPAPPETAPEEGASAGDGRAEALRLAAEPDAETLGTLGAPIQQLRRRLSVRQMGSSFVVSVTMRSEDPVKAAAIANTVMTEYIAFHVDKRFEAAQRFTNWLETRIGDLAAKLERSQRDVLEYRAVIEGGADSGERLEQQMREMTSKLVTSRAALAEAEARVAKAEEVIGRGGALAAADVLSSPVILDLRAELAATQARRADAARRVGARSPQALDLERREAQLRTRIEDEVRRTVLELGNSASVLAINVQALEDSLLDIERRSRERSEEEIAVNQLERIADANRRVYEEFLRRYNEATEIRNLRTTDAEVVSYAGVPGAPATPRGRVALTLALAAGALVGLAAAFLLELRPRRVAGASEATRLTGLSALGGLPNLPASARADRLGALLARDPSGHLARGAAEALRGAELSLGGPMRSLLVTAPEAGPMRTTAAMLLAWAATRRGRSCVLVDADTRRASLSARLSPPAGAPDLLSVLRGEASLDDAVFEVDALGVSALATARTGADPAAVLGSQSAAETLAALAERFDVVVVDAPAMTMPSEVVRLRRRLDMGLMVVRPGRTRADALVAAREMLDEVDLRDVGAVLAGGRTA